MTSGAFGFALLMLVAALFNCGVASAISRPNPVASSSVDNAPGYCPSQGGSRAYETIAAVETTPQSNGTIRIQVDVVLLNPEGCHVGTECPSYDGYPTYVNAWIDWNGNHVWEPSERVMDQERSDYTSINYQGTLRFIQQVTVSSSAVTETFMRVTMGYACDPNDPWTSPRFVDSLVMLPTAPTAL